MIRAAAVCLLSSFALTAQDAAAPPVFRVDTRLVEVYANVFDKHGNPLPNLARDRFQVFDGEKPQSLIAFEGAEENLSCALLLDVTGSMDSFLPALKTAVVEFVDSLRDGESTAVYTFTTTLRLAQPFTADKKLAKQAVLYTRAGGGTALFDAVSKVSRDVENRKGKKAIVVFTDGDDNASALSAAGASRQARRSGVPLYIIAEGAALKEAALMKTLEQMAADTGGLAFRLQKPGKIGEVFAEISRNLRHCYLLSWKLPDDAGASWRPIRIAVAGAEDAHIRARQGYWPQ